MWVSDQHGDHWNCGLVVIVISVGLDCGFVIWNSDRLGLGCGFVIWNCDQQVVLFFIFVFDGGGWQRLAMGVAVWVCKERGGFSEKGRDADTKREKETYRE